MLLTLLVGCPAGLVEADSAGDTASADTAPARDSGDSGDSGDTGDTDTADPGPTSGCPAGMSPIPPEAPLWCIDTYERGVQGDTFGSAPGLEPEVGMTYSEAAAFCAELEVTDDRGQVYGVAHLATAEEWEDAGDGVIGPGGLTFPWGDDWDDQRCVTLSDAGQEQFDGEQPTGSLAGCVSPFGVVDQIGNVWEWLDSGLAFDVAGSFTALAAAGLTLEEGDGAALRLTSGEATRLSLSIPGLLPGTVHADGDGALYALGTELQTDPDGFFARGYLRSAEPLPVALPVALVRRDTSDPESDWTVTLARGYDGQAMPDKRGCAWYTGTDQGCGLAQPNVMHMPDFDGTIGFRCATPPWTR